MHVLRTAPSSHRRFMWLLWLVLLLPIAQTAATLHVLSHALSDQGGESVPIDGKQAIQHAHCDLCLTAAALIGAAPPPVTAPYLARLTALHRLPSAGSSSVWFAPTGLVYESRAPPSCLL